MANYSLVVDSKFTPFTLEESLKPALLATEMHYDLEDKYNTLADTASGIEGLINPALDAELYERTKQYADDLNAQVELLSKEGLSPNLRRNLGTLKSRFASELAPIKTAYDNREKASKLVRELSIKDPSMIIERDPRTLSLKEFIDNPELDQGRYISGKDLSNRVAQAVQNAKKTIFANRPSAWNSIFGGQYYEKKNITGWTEQEINDAIAGKGPKELRDIVDNVLASSGITEWATPEQLEAARRYSNEGLWSGLGTTDYERIQNRAWTPTPSNAENYGFIPLKGDPFIKDVLVGKDTKESIDNIMQTTAGHPSLKDSVRNNLNSMLSASLSLPTKLSSYGMGMERQYKMDINSDLAKVSPAFKEYASAFNSMQDAYKINHKQGLDKSKLEEDLKKLQNYYTPIINEEIEAIIQQKGKNAVLHSIDELNLNVNNSKEISDLIKSKGLTWGDIINDPENEGSIKISKTANPITGTINVHTLGFSPSIGAYIRISQDQKSSAGLEGTSRGIIPLSDLDPIRAAKVEEMHHNYLKQIEEVKALESLLSDSTEIAKPEHLEEEEWDDLRNNVILYKELIKKTNLTGLEKLQLSNIIKDFNLKRSNINDIDKDILQELNPILNPTSMSTITYKP